MTRAMSLIAGIKQMDKTHLIREKLKTIDLCAGIGGIRRGFELTGRFENVLSAEIDDMACKTYQHLFGDNPKNDVFDDHFVDRIKSTPYDVLLAGFPCQAFSSVGLRQGFDDHNKGTVFFAIKRIIKETYPKIVFLENVQNLLSHNNKETFATIIETLENDLDYKVIGVSRDENGDLKYQPSSFLRNSRFFGVPQNRPRVYIVAFSRMYYGSYLSLIPDQTPEKRMQPPVYESIYDVLEDEVDSKYFLSAGYLETLEKHVINQHNKGNGFGYKIINPPEVSKPIANTLLATGGSGKERNLIYDYRNGPKYAGTFSKWKKTAINHKSVRTLTPTEWGRLQGFIGYAFLNSEGDDLFSFPPETPDAQRYKQFGNSVSIPVIEELARFVINCNDCMFYSFKQSDLIIYNMDGNIAALCRSVIKRLPFSKQEKTRVAIVTSISKYKDTMFSISEFADTTTLSYCRANQLLLELLQLGCVVKSGNLYRFVL